MLCMPQVVVRITDTQMAWLEGQVEQFRPKSVVIRDLIDSAMKGVDTTFTLYGASESFPAKERGSERSTSTSTSIKETTSNRSNKKTTQKKKDAFSVKHLPDSIQVPDAIVDCDQLLREYWSVKKGTRSESVWNRICNKLGAWTPSDRRKALEAAINSGWADVYEPKPDRPAAKPKSTLDYEAMDKMKMPW